MQVVAGAGVVFADPQFWFLHIRNLKDLIIFYFSLQKLLTFVFL